MRFPRLIGNRNKIPAPLLGGRKMWVFLWETHMHIKNVPFPLGRHTAKWWLLNTLWGVRKISHWYSPCKSPPSHSLGADAWCGDSAECSLGPAVSLFRSLEATWLLIQGTKECPASPRVSLTGHGSQTEGGQALPSPHWAVQTSPWHTCWAGMCGTVDVQGSITGTGPGMSWFGLQHIKRRLSCRGNHLGTLVNPLVSMQTQGWMFQEQP